MAHDIDLQLAHSLADAARGVSLSFFRKEFDRWTKPDGSIVTAADLATETEIRALLARERPDDAILGEEHGESGASNRRWVVDAIDGTHDFAAGSPNWATLIALEVDGQVVVGVCDQPAHDRRYWATRGGGAFCANPTSSSEPQRLAVSDRRTLAASQGYVPPPEWRPDDRAKRIAESVGSVIKVEALTNHPAIDVGLGKSDLCVFLIAGPWDLAAPLIIVEEAGGKFTDLDGRRDWTTGTAVFSNGRVHDELIRLTSA